MRTVRKGFSIAEVAVVLFVISYGLMSVYLILGRGWKLAETTSNRIEAINLAREGVEAVTNARDTNWVKFAADYPSCWKVQNYDKTCVGAPVATQGDRWFGSGDIASAKPFVPYLSGSLWYFTAATNTGVYVDALGLPFQTGAVTLPALDAKTCQLVDPNAVSCRSNMRRTIFIGHPTSPAECGATGTGCLSVSSKVEWYDGASRSTHVVQLDTTLTNWRNNF